MEIKNTPKSRRMTEQEQLYLIKNKHKTNKQLSEEIGRGRLTIGKFFLRQGITPQDRKIKYTKEEIVAVLCSSKTQTEAWQKLSLTEDTFKNHCNYYNIDIYDYFNKTQKLTIEQQNFIREHYQDMSANEIAKQIGCTQSTVAGLWHREGYRGKTYRKFPLNENYFEKIDSEAKAYFVGFIAADGCVHCRTKGKNIGQMLLTISLHIKDEHIIKTFCEELGCPDRKLYYDKKQHVSVQISSKKLCTDLQQYGIVPRKTHILQIKNIPKEYMRHFLRGYFDGDGTITFGNKENLTLARIGVSIIGKEQTFKWMKEFLKSIGFVSISITEDKREKYSLPMHSLVFNDMVSKYLFMRFLYDDSKVFLKRKKELATLFVELVGDYNPNQRHKERKTAIENFQALELNWRKAGIF